MLRSVKSIAAAERPDVRVTVVAHGISPDDVPGLRALESDQLRLEQFADGIPSPAGPFNHGLERATAKYVGVLGSDDYLDSGALDAWIAQAERHRLDVLFAGLQHQDGVKVRNPAVRPWRRNNLDVSKDRLFSRAAPIGLILRRQLEQPRLRFAEGLRTGEDIPFTTALLARARRVGVAFDSPRYVIGADAVDRVTSVRPSIETMLAPLKQIVESEWFAILPEQVRTAVLTARIRANVLADVVFRDSHEAWSADEISQLRDLLVQADLHAPHALEPLPARDQRLLDSLRATVLSGEDAVEAVESWGRSSKRDSVLPEKLRYSLHRESTLVRYVGYYLARLGA